jgi:hypothetical protein
MVIGRPSSRRVGQVLGLPANNPQAAATARNQWPRACLTAGGLHALESLTLPLTTDPRSLRGR